MKINKLIVSALILMLCFTTSCKDSVSEKLEDSMDDKVEALEDKSDDIEDRADDIEDAQDYVVEGFDDIEDALEKFREALEEVDNPEDRKAIRERINKILDDIELQKQ